MDPVFLSEREARALTWAVVALRDLNSAAAYPHPANGCDHTDLTMAVTKLNRALRAEAEAKPIRNRSFVRRLLFR